MLMLAFLLLLISAFQCLLVAATRHTLIDRNHQSASQFNDITPFCMAERINKHLIFNQAGVPIPIPGRTDFYRKPYEDRIIRKSFLLINGERVFMHGVLDGHGHADVAEHLAQTFHQQLAHRMNQRLDALTSPQAVFELIGQLVLDVDWEVCAQIGLKGGSTASFVVRFRETAFVVNVGDSKTYVFQGSQLILATKLHSPLDPEEAEHVDRAGGSVVQGRINGLAISRAFGDCHLKMSQQQWAERVDTRLNYNGLRGLVRVFPDILVIPLKPDQSYSFLSTTDGLFERVPQSPKKPVDDALVSSYWKWRQLYGREICAKLLSEALIRQSMDDITLLVIKTSSGIET